MFKKLLIVALITIGVISCATSPTGRSQFMAISPEKAISESEKAYLSTVNELDQKDQLVNDPQESFGVPKMNVQDCQGLLRLYEIE